MERESILRHVYGTTSHREAKLDRPVAVLPLPARRKPMQKPATAKWDLDISADDFTQLKLGFAGSNQDHKWTIAAGDPDESGVVPIINIIRRGLNMERYILLSRPAAYHNGAKIESLVWDTVLGTDGNTGVLEHQAKKEAVFLCRVHAGCAFENLPKYEASIFWDPKPENEGDENGENTMG